MELDTVVATIEHRKLSAIIRTVDEMVARRAMRAAVDGGFTLIEFTLNTPGALGLITDFATDGDLLVGAGTVLSAEDAHRAVEAGARFIVSPVFDPEVVAAARGLGVASIPGTFTPTEMLAAHRAGADFVKLFPSPDDLPRYVSQLRGPLPFLRIFPTAGVNEDNFLPILRAGAIGVGFVTSLFVPEELARGDFDAVEERARRIHRLARENGVI